MKKGKPCPHCGQPQRVTTEEWGNAIRAGQKKAEKLGFKTGRPRVADYAKIRALRKAGFSIRQCAAKFNVSMTVIKRAAYID